MQTRGHFISILRRSPRIVASALISVLILAGMAFPNIQRAISAATCASISDCQQQITNDSNAVAGLEGVATGYQDALNKLQVQINSIQQQISISQQQQATVEAQIADAEEKLVQQRQVLGTDIKMQYVNGGISTAEMLASSQNLSAFADSETYRSAVQAKVQDTLNTITSLEKKLQLQKDQVTQLLAGQQQQAGQLADAKRRQQDMLAYNEAQQANFAAQVSQNRQKLSDLIAAQRAANNSTDGGYYFLRFPGAGKNDPINGSYPYANYPFSMSTAPGCNDGDGPDQWGYCTRQCVSYAAWAVQYSGGNAPIEWGNAKDWVGAARRAGIPVYSSPEPGDIAIDTAGTWGHAMYVEKVSGSQIFVSQYNQQLTGQFSTQWRTWD